jgi:hypothetical protein
VNDRRTPPPGITPLPRPDIEAVSAVTTEIIKAARLTGLAIPSHYSGHDYGPPAITLHLSATTPRIWDALQAWADTFGGDLTTRPASDPGTIHAVTEFRRSGIRCEVWTIIKPSDDDPGDPPQEEGRA